LKGDKYKTKVLKQPQQSDSYSQYAHLGGSIPVTRDWISVRNRKETG